MDFLDIIIGFIILIASATYIAYGLIMLKQASRFYKLSKRTVLSSIFYISSSIGIFTILIGSYIGMILN